MHRSCPCQLRDLRFEDRRLRMRRKSLQSLRLDVDDLPQFRRRVQPGGKMALTRRRFLKRVAAAGSVSLAYEAMSGLGLLAAPSQMPFNLSGRVSGVRLVILGAGLAGMT